MTIKFLPLLSLLLALLVSSSSAQNQAPAPKPLKILFVGNSYTGGIRKTVSELIRSSPHSQTKITFIHPGGKTLAFHLADQKTLQSISEGGFNFVVLQDQSQTPAIFPEKFQEAAAALDKIIDRSGAQTVFYQTWGRRDGDKQNAKLFPDYQTMQSALSKSYLSAAKSCQAQLAPVGETWKIIRQKHPDLGKELYQKDGSHPSAKGAYLAACVFYATFFDEDPRNITFTGGLPAKEAQLIREAAFAATKPRIHPQ